MIIQECCEEMGGEKWNISVLPVKFTKILALVPC